MFTFYTLVQGPTATVVAIALVFSWSFQAHPKYRVPLLPLQGALTFYVYTQGVASLCPGSAFAGPTAAGLRFNLQPSVQPYTLTLVDHK